jgi:uncharacterized OsmC-like protein
VTGRDIKALYDLKAAALARHPEMGLEAGQTFASVDEERGLSCRVQHEDRCLSVDLPPEDGGTGDMPHPGQLMRAAVSAGLALGYRIWAARLGVPLGRCEVGVCCDYDTRGQLGVDPGVAAHWRRITIDVVVSGGVTDAEARRVVAVANRHSLVLANLSPAIEQIHRLTVVAAGAERNVPSEGTPHK